MAHDGNAEGGHVPPYRLLAEMASDVAMEINAASRVVWISANIEEVLGWSVDEIVGTSIFDRMHPDDVARGSSARDKVMSGDVVRNDLRFLTKSGTYRWMSARLAPVLDEHGEVVGRVAGWHDVSAEYELRDRLRDREAQFRILVENANDVVLLQVEERVVFVSPAVDRVLGWSPDELIGREVADLWHHDDRDAATQDSTSLRADGSNVMRMLHKNGEMRWIEMSVSPITQPDGRPGAVSILRDVTDAVRAEQTLTSIHARDAALASMSSDLFLILDRAGAVLWASGASESLFGRSNSQLVGVNAIDTLMGIGTNAGDFRARIAAGEMVSGVVEVHPMDRPSRWIDVRAMQHADVSEPDSWLFVSIRDAQTEMEVRAALEASEREANEANQAKTAFLSRMSHELRTPLNAILGFAQLLQLQQLPPSEAGAVDKIVAGGRHLLDLINEVLDIARIESGRLTVTVEPVPLADMVTESLDLVRGLASTSAIHIESFDTGQCDVQVLADRQSVIQILLNLLSNAVKYNRPGGAVRAGCGHNDDGTAWVQIEDTGFGIAPELLDRLFQPFDRLGAERTGIEGTGIGLAVARGLAETMGGRVDVRSTVQVGSVFTLVLPIAAP